MDEITLEQNEDGFWAPVRAGKRPWFRHKRTKQLQIVQFEDNESALAWARAPTSLNPAYELIWAAHDPAAN